MFKSIGVQTFLQETICIWLTITITLMKNGVD